MDEPTNHLDMETVDALAKALERFKVIAITVEPPIMDPPTRGQPLIRDTLHGTICILLVLFNLPPKDSLRIKDSVSARKVSFIRRLYCTIVPVLG